jgi:hypothetical protein
MLQPDPAARPTIRAVSEHLWLRGCGRFFEPVYVNGLAAAAGRGELQPAADVKPAASEAAAAAAAASPRGGAAPPAVARSSSQQVLSSGGAGTAARRQQQPAAPPAAAPAPPPPHRARDIVLKAAAAAGARAPQPPSLQHRSSGGGTAGAAGPFRAMTDFPNWYLALVAGPVAPRPAHVRAMYFADGAAFAAAADAKPADAPLPHFFCINQELDDGARTRLQALVA